MSVIGLLHPGEMGAAIGRSLRGAAHTVLWASAGRSSATADRAAEADLTDAKTVEAVGEQADVVLSVCPPHAAVDVARQVGGFGGLYVDANAVGPATAHAISALSAGPFVDGGIIGPPPDKPGRTRLYLSGARASEVATLFTGTVVDARVIPDGEIGAASALKMAYAAWTKGTSALLLAIRALARSEGVDEALLAEWALSQPALADRCADAAAAAEAKGWRWIAEMEQIAATMAGDGLPTGFHQAAADIYRRWPELRANREAAPDLHP